MVAVLRQVSESRLDGVVAAVFSGPPPRRRGRPPEGSENGIRWAPPPITKEQRGGRVLDGYFSDLQRYTPLTQDQERELFLRYRDGDLGARRKILLHNLRFVVRVAKQYTSSGLPLPDLISEGNHGLVMAVERFDVNKNFKFISYAVWWIRQSILRAISMQSRQLKLPLNQTQKIVAISKATERLQQARKRQPSVEEIAEEAGLKLAEVLSMVAVMTPHARMDGPVGRGKSSFSDTVPDREESALDRLEGEDVSAELTAALSVLSGKEKTAVLEYFGFNNEFESTLQEIGDRMGVSRERVRQLRDKGLRKIREHMTGAGGKGERHGRGKKGRKGKKAQEGEAEG